jgi:hypothetical protein
VLFHKKDINTDDDDDSSCSDNVTTLLPKLFAIGTMTLLVGPAAVDH